MVEEDGTFTVGPGAYVDDVVAFLLGAVKTNPTISGEIKGTLRDFLNRMDRRAVERHGYSASPKEKDYTWVDL